MAIIKTFESCLNVSNELTIVILRYRLLDSTFTMNVDIKNNTELNLWFKYNLKEKMKPGVVLSLHFYFRNAPTLIQKSSLK